MEIQRETSLPVDRETAWQAISDPESLEAWFAERAEVEARPGGRVSFTLAGGERRDGFVEEVSEGERLVFWWGAAEGERELSRVELELADDGDGTALRVTETLAAITVDSVLTAGSGGAGPTMLAGVR